MEIEVGEYVRTKSGGIGKIIEIDNDCSCSHIITDNETFGLGWDGEQVNWDYITEIVKSSTNIIDLIEVGDYVNGSKVLDVMENLETGKVHLEMTANYTNEELGDCTIYNKDIKSIVTKEQFRNIEYEV